MVEGSTPASPQKQGTMARLSSQLDDAARLRQLGYKQELSRELSLLKNVS